MKRSEIIEAFRQEVDDVAQPFLWTPRDVDRYLNAAVREVAFRARLIYDTLTVEDANAVAVCSIAVTAPTASYAVHPSIFEVERARLNSRPLREWLKVTSQYQMDRDEPGWESYTGTPRFLVVEHAGKAFRATLVPAPVTDDTLWLSVYRLPLEDQNSADDEPEIPAVYHLHLVDYMMHLAYRKQDAETRDEQKSLDALKRFTMYFGEARDATVQRQQQDRRKNVVRARGF
jgi:hypothetical protein